jgi:hypothetical protein
MVSTAPGFSHADTVVNMSAAPHNEAVVDARASRRRGGVEVVA